MIYILCFILKPHFILFHFLLICKILLLTNNNIDILLFLAKYNPKITKEDIIKNFGEESVKGLKHLKQLHLVKEEDNKVTLTEEGIFQVEGLLSIAI